ncbi:helix-turn-helix domain-containing protein [Sandaracinus amylolyticus]|uniref:HTH cro/C1-type domain-containing protein n=1 Tax=Sandaracinus amylolyticus TaxID=927083 RepID=A0A0F6YGP9_9BACT|nr:helix-turn-helix transcriptional regulator [Sandaracinus amylolyticus]AKF04953.1 hypothetical protein DB32_002102 [Sandaracinus amylolyticus]
MASSSAETAWKRVTRATVRALRGKRSQRVASEKLGYETNVLYDWERGRRSPVTTEVVRLAALRAAPRWEKEPVRLPVAFADVRTLADVDGVASYLRAITSGHAVTRLASAIGVTRATLGRWLRGLSEPRFHEFLALVDACGALPDLVIDALGIDASTLPLPEGPRKRRSIEDAFESEPLLAVLIPALSVRSVQRAKDPVAELARGLDVPEARVLAALELCATLGIARKTRQGWALIPDDGPRVVSARRTKRFGVAFREMARSRALRPGFEGPIVVLQVDRERYERLQEHRRAIQQMLMELSTPLPTADRLVLVSVELHALFGDAP